MQGRLWLTAVLWIVQPTTSAQVATDRNVVATAEDAFGLTLGPESLGLYNSSNVRGFNPIAAGNVRINGLYFDQQGTMGDRLVGRTRIRVGLSAVDFPWPAPTGIVDYTLRQPEEPKSLSTTLYAGPYESREIDVESYRRLYDGHAAIAAAATYRHDVYIPGLTQHLTSFGIMPQWTPDKDFAVRAFWGRVNFTDAKNLPVTYVSAGQAPPRVPTRYFGQAWTGSDNLSEHYGILVDARSNGHWSVRAGVFRSTLDVPRSYADLYLNATSRGIADHMLLAEPDQYYGSTSGEFQLSHRMMGRWWQQHLHLGVRGRDLRARYGGADAVDVGIGVVGQIEPLNSPAYSLRTRTADHIREYSIGASYTLRWNDHFEWTAAAQRPSYWREVIDPTLGSSITAAHPWLYNSTLVSHPTKRLDLFGSLTRGLEDAGIAPANASNRGAVLAAVRSSQDEAGLRYALTPSAMLVLAGFDVQKPYFALNDNGAYQSVGRERHRGLEFSLAGQLVSGLNVVAGAMFMSPTVTASSQERIGRIPIGQPRRVAQLSIDYHLPRLPGLSFDCAVTARGAQVTRADNLTEVAGYATVDLGAHYKMTVGDYPATLRVQLLNVGGSANWYVGPDGGLTPLAERRIFGYLVVDLR